MWSPTHTQVTVQRARGLLTKGKNGTNNCFVTIALGKEKYQTSVKEKAETSVNWNEECELKIPDQGNRAELVLTCLHRNNLGIDEFLGQATLPLNEMDVYDRPRSKWFKLESKPGKEKKNKERGELEVRIAFVVKSGSLTDLSKKDKHKSSIGQLASSVGGSLLSIGQIEKRKGIKKFAKSLGSKMHLNGKKKNNNKDADDNSSFSGSFASIGTPNSSTGGGGGSRRYGQRAGDADPGVISEDEDEFVFDNLSHKSSGSSLNIQRSGLQPPTPNFAPRNPSPLLSSNNGVAKLAAATATTTNGKLNNNGGKPRLQEETVEEDPIDPEMEQLELDFSVRARTLPPPSKPPRTPHSSIGKADTQLAALAATGVAATQKKTLHNNNDQDDDDDGHGAVADAKANANTADGDVLTNAASVVTGVTEAKGASKLDEWEAKLYGGKNGNSDSLKRCSWELARVPLPTPAEAEQNVHVKQQQVHEKVAKAELPASVSSSSLSSSDTDSDIEKVGMPTATVATPPQPRASLSSSSSSSAALIEAESRQQMVQHSTPVEQPRVRPRSTLLSPDVEKRNFNEFNASFAKFEQRHGAKIFDSDADDDGDDNNKYAVVGLVSSPPSSSSPQVKPRASNNNSNSSSSSSAEKELKLKSAAVDIEVENAAAAELARQRAEEDARLEAELRLNEQRLREEEEALKRELHEEEQRRREAKRHEEDQRLLNFAKRSSSSEDDNAQLALRATTANDVTTVVPMLSTTTITTTTSAATIATTASKPISEAIIEHNFLTPEQSPTEFSTSNALGNGSGSERREKRLGKFKYSSNINGSNINNTNNSNNIKRDKYNNENDSNSPSPKSTERIIIGHEKAATHAERRSEITTALTKKYEGKSREELMLIANGMENEALLQRQRVKELEDYLDNLLLRVMETHPKILQNPYSRTTSAKSG